MKIIIVIMVIVMVGISGCKSLQKSATSPQDKVEPKIFDSSHNSQNSLDWEGIYRGVLPCDDCEGIQMTVYLNRNLSFTTKTRYIGKSDSIYVETVRFIWNEKGSAITFRPDDKSQNIQYFVGENMLTQLDLQGNKNTGENANRYILSKSNYAILEKYWKLVELNGKPVAVDSTFRKEPYIIFKESDNRLSGNGGCNIITGNYKIESPNRITISKIITTQMACPRSDTEHEFLDALQKADNYIITSDMLVLNKARWHLWPVSRPFTCKNIG